MEEKARSILEAVLECESARERIKYLDRVYADENEDPDPRDKVREMVQVIYAMSLADLGIQQRREAREGTQREVEIAAREVKGDAEAEGILFGFFVHERG